MVDTLRIVDVSIDTRKRRLNETPVEGFEAGRVNWARDLVESLGLPLDRVTGISYKPALHGERRNVLGLCNQGTGEVIFFKSCTELPQIAQLGVVAHELAHDTSPFQVGLQRVFTCEQARASAAQHTDQIAQQTLDTNVFINGYHKMLARQYREGSIDFERFAEETWAIMVEHRYTSPKHLQQVEEAQRKSIERRNNEERLQAGKVNRQPRLLTHTNIMTQPGSSDVVGIDLALLDLTGKKGLAELDEHIDGIKKKLKSPFSA